MSSNSNHGPGSGNAGHPPHPEPGHQPKVTITYGDQTKEVGKGTYSVAQIKEWFGIPASDTLEIAKGNKLDPQPDDGSLHLTHDITIFACPKVGTSA